LGELSNDIAIPKQFRGEAVPGMSRFYEQLGLRSFDRMNEYLRKYGDELRAAKVFDGIKVASSPERK
jgi:hypothetical protein